jgi:hypothetical protein
MEHQLLLIWNYLFYAWPALPLAFLGMEEDYCLSGPWKSDKLDCNLSLIFDDLLTRQIWALAFPSNFAPQHKYPTRKKHKGTLQYQIGQVLGMFSTAQVNGVNYTEITQESQAPNYVFTITSFAGQWSSKKLSLWKWISL